MTENSITPTEEQQSIISAMKQPEPLMVQAFAGTAKTTSISLAAPGVKVPALALAFNRKIAEELKSKLPGNWTVKTLNGLGSLAWIRSLPAEISVKLEDRKLGRIVSKNIKDSRVELSRDQWGLVRELVSKAMQVGLSPGNEGEPLTEDSPENWQNLAGELFIDPRDRGMMIDLARASLIDDIALAKQGIISFDDQVYCPTILGGNWLRYPALAVDESQDLSPLNHRMIERSVRNDAKLLVVGDAKQAIYGWRGADMQSMESLRRLRQSWRDERLTICFRCPQVVVERQQSHAPGFRSAASAAKGIFRAFRGKSEAEPEALDGWSFGEIKALCPEGSIAVICRNNAPLIGLAFKLIRQGIGPVILGRDLGKGLVALSRKIAEDSDPAGMIEGKIAEWEITEISRLGEEDREGGKATTISDRAECLRAVLGGSGARDGRELRQAIELVFSRPEGQLVLSTIHRAKGLEWDLVCHLDPWRVPSRRSRKLAIAGDSRELEQELNLVYVCETRTRKILVTANLEDFQ